jgi:glycosyltransferase involved in cell wall biosynthesis
LELSLIIPACNEEKRIQATLESYVSYLQKSGIRHEIIVEMDGCTDGTADIVRRMGLIYPQIRALEFKERLGKGGGLLKGFDVAIGDIIGFVDADGSIQPEEMMKLLDSVRAGSDCAIGSRRMKGAEVSNQNGVRRMLSKCFNIMVRTLFFMPYKDTQCGAKVYRAKALRKVLSEIHVNGFIFDVVLLYCTKKNDFSVTEIPIKWEDKAGSKVNVVSTTMDMFSSVLKLRIYYSPLRKLFQKKDNKKPSKIPDTVQSPRY